MSLDSLSAIASRLYLGVVYDALRFDLDVRRPFVVDRAIKPAFPLTEREVLFGPAFTCRGERVLSPEHIDDTVRIRMFRSMPRGSVQVIDTGGDESVAHFGDISGKLARKFGAVGAVIDGSTRDVRILEQDRFPVFCRSVQPIDAYGRWQIVAYEEPVFLAGPEGRVPVAPGDYVFGDPDGVLVIPKELAEAALHKAKERSDREDRVRTELRETDDIQGLYDRIGRW
ncbi:MAG TPA: RraA family protein [Polyangiaceae bacterium]|nr:RraA family protein [Polyangiaceae bacterium]